MNPYFYGYEPTYEDEREDDQFAINDFLTPAEVQGILAIGKNTFYRLVNSGELPAFRIGKLWRVRKDDLMNFQRRS